MASTLEHLFSPLTLGPVELENRIVSTAHQTTLVHDHLPSDDFVAYHEARARGGAGLIVLEATAVHPSGLLTPHTLGGYLPELVRGYRRVVEAVRPTGTRLFVQLFHGGREQIASAPRSPALAPSPVPSQRFRVEPRAMRSGEIDEIVAGYAQAAEIAAAGGLDGVEISAAHRYLIEEFFDPSLNRREDEWRDGGRFLLAVVRAVRAAASDLCVGVRLSADSSSGAGMARLLSGEDVDYVSVALGDSSTYLGSVGIVPPGTTGENAIAEPAAAIDRAHALIATSRIVDVAAADRLLAAGVADAVGMTRALIADPELPAKARDGRLDEIVPCIACNACIAHYHAGTPIACTVNPRTGRERQIEPRGPARSRRRLVVVGAGPAGLAAAVEAGAAGHDVVVLERSQRIGGQIALAGAAPGNAGIAAALVGTARRQLAAAGVELRLGASASAGDVLAEESDGVVVATGARPYVDPDLELEGVEVHDAWTVLARDMPAGLRVVVADWGGDPGALDAAEVLAAAGNNVTLAVASVAVAEGLHQYRRNLYLQRLYRAEVTIGHHLELTGASGGAVRFRNAFAPERETTFEADVLVLSLGRVPEDGLAAELAAAGASFEEAGDCRAPRSLEEAVLEGTLAARRVLA
ncbi:MAG TPA: FAD-dependent oxidoreductase [Gaiellaceae bacterium]|nr:FAD-dependent oxidoreductase [Gaiellaceae bacterium]